MTMDFTESKHNAGTNIEGILFVVSAMLVAIKISSILFNQKRIRTNLNAAINDWLTAKGDEETWEIMKKYAFRARTLTHVLLYSGLGCFSIYILSIVMINLKQIFFTDPNTVDGKTFAYFYSYL